MEITEEELQKKIDEAVKKATDGLKSQEEVDKIVSKRVTELNEKHKKELEDEKSKAKMTAEELKEKELEDLKNKLAEKDNLLKQKEHTENITKLMTEKGIGNEFFDMFAGISDLEKARSQMDSFTESLKAKVDAEIESKIKPHVPGKSGAGDNNNDEALRNAMGL